MFYLCRQWTPPPGRDSWTPPTSDWVPPTTGADAPLTTGDPDETPVAEAGREGDSAEMRQLLEMGFANRDANSELLEKHRNNMERVIQALVAVDNDWPAGRH